MRWAPIWNSKLPKVLTVGVSAGVDNNLFQRQSTGTEKTSDIGRNPQSQHKIMTRKFCFHEMSATLMSLRIQETCAQLTGCSQSKTFVIFGRSDACNKTEKSVKLPAQKRYEHCHRSKHVQRGCMLEPQNL